MRINKTAVGILVGVSCLGVVAFGVSADNGLKVPKDKITHSHEYTQYEYDDKGKIKSQKQVVSYFYKSDELAPAFKDEILEKRTPHIVTRDLGGDKRSAQSGYNFYKENGKWKKIKHATTTPEVFNKVSLFGALVALASDTGATSPGTMANDNTVGIVEWSNVDNAKVSDDTYSTVAGWSGGVTYYAKATNFGFSIPVNATINGILAEVQRKSNVSNSWVTDEYTQIIKSDDSIGSTNKADTTTHWGTTNTYVSYGASNNLWDETWAYTDINNSNFGIVFSAELHYDASYIEASIDHIRITVYYTAGGAGEEEPTGNVKVNGSLKVNGTMIIK